MDFYDYPAIKDLHQWMAWATILLFTVRGIAVLGGASWPRDSRLRLLHDGVVFLLVIAGLSLWGLMNINPIHHGWLATKLLLAVVFALLSWATFHEETPDTLRALSFLAGLAVVALLVRVAQTRDPLFGLG